MTQRVHMSDPALTGVHSVYGTCSFTGRWMLSSVILITAFSLTNASAAKKPQRTVTAAYRIDLRSVQRSAPLPQLGTRETNWIPIVTMEFLNNQRLAATFVVQSGGKPGLARRDEKNANMPLRLRAVVIEASTGKLLANPEWPAYSRAAGIVAANDKGFVIDDGRDLTLLSADLRPLKQLPLPPLASHSGALGRGEWAPSLVWSGRRVLLFGGQGRTTWLWVDAENLQVLASRQDTKSGPLAASDNLIAMAEWQTSPSAPRPRYNLAIRTVLGEWKPVPISLNVGLIQFVGPDLLYLHVSGGFGMDDEGVYLVHIGSGQSLRLTSPWGPPGQAAVARSGKRFVVLLEQTKGFHPALDINGHNFLRGLLVFDPPFRTPSYNIVVRNSKLKDPDWVALSPDGCHLAVIGDSRLLLEVFDLPPPKQAQSCH